VEQSTYWAIIGDGPTLAQQESLAVVASLVRGAIFSLATAAGVHSIIVSLSQIKRGGTSFPTCFDNVYLLPQ
jgi:hypothetical protein